MSKLFWGRKILLSAIVYGLAACAYAAPKPGFAGEMIAEGVISTPDDELGGSITADGSTLYFEKSVPPHYLYIMCESHWQDGKWGAPTVLPFSGEYRDTDPVLTPDGNAMLFASDRPVDGVDRHHFFIWEVKKTDKGWGEPGFVHNPVNDGFDQVFASRASNGNMYFTSSRESGKYDVFRTRLVDGKYQEAEDLGADFNGPTTFTFEAFVAPDESFLLLGAFGREDSLGSSDLYISYNVDGKWTKPRTLGPTANTRARDYSPRISGDGKWLLFTSETGMSTEPRSTPITYDEFVKASRGLHNGLGNLYRVPLGDVLRDTKP